MLVTSGVSQGSILGTLLLAIYINDVTHDIVLSDYFLFADDSKLLCTSLRLNCHPQADVTIFKSWAGQNLMNFNTAKRQVIRFSSNPTSPHYLTLNSEPITETDYIRYLGVFIGKSLNSNLHVDNNIKKA